MTVHQIVVACVAAWAVVDYQYAVRDERDYHRKVLGMALERNVFLEGEVERLATLEELAEMERLLDYRIHGPKVVKGTATSAPRDDALAVACHACNGSGMVVDPTGQAAPVVPHIWKPGDITRGKP